MEKWLSEKRHRELGQFLLIGRVIHRETSKLQELLIFENWKLGRVLAIDGVIQTTEADEFIYHES